MASFFDVRIFVGFKGIGLKNNKMLYLFLGENGIIFRFADISKSSRLRRLCSFEEGTGRRRYWP